MSKYIDTEKLLLELNKRMGEYDVQQITSEHPEYEQGAQDALYNLKLQLASFQQEQPKVDLVAELKHHLATTPKEQLEKEWKELEPWGNIGPTVQEFLYGKQPEVELKKEIEEWADLMVGASFPEQDGDFISEEDYRSVIRQTAIHFLGINARKEE